MAVPSVLAEDRNADLERAICSQKSQNWLFMPSAQPRPTES